MASKTQPSGGKKSSGKGDRRVTLAAPPAKRPAASALASLPLEEQVRNVLSGGASAADMSVKALALLAVVRLEQQRPQYFDRHGVYTGNEGLSTLLASMLGVTKNRARNAMTHMREARVYTSSGLGAAATITFIGSAEARALAGLEEPADNSGTDIFVSASSGDAEEPGPDTAPPVPSDPSPHEPAVELSTLPSAEMLTELLAEVIANEVWRSAGRNPAVVAAVVVRLQHSLA